MFVSYQKYFAAAAFVQVKLSFVIIQDVDFKLSLKYIWHKKKHRIELVLYFSIS
jgi:hypothetical protein